MITIIVAIANDHSIGKDNQLLWQLPNDMKHFRQRTTGHAIVMGRKTFESFPKGALPNRKNIVLTHQPSLSYPGVVCCTTLDEALREAATATETFIIGGETLYRQTLPMADKLCITRVDTTYPDADTFFPAIDEEEWVEIHRESHPPDEKHAYAYTFVDYVRKP